MNAKTNAERQADHTARMKAKGFQRVPVWVPKDRVKDIHEAARKMREGVADAEEKGNGNG